MRNKKEFSPLIFLASLGAGGLSVAFFALINYTFDHGKGLVNFAQTHNSMAGFTEGLYSLLELGMIGFAIIHFVLSIIFLPQLIKWIKSSSYKKFVENPLVNVGILAPFISLAMTMNVLLASVRYFVPSLYNNLQSLMIPGLIVWIVLWFFTMRMAIKLLKISFIKGFDISKIYFGWLLYPFALGMLSVTGAGIAAMSQAPMPAHIAFFMLLISGTMGIFLMMVKLNAIFKNHFALEGLPDKQFLPSLLIIVPNITLYAIIAFRIGHYLHNHFNAQLNVYYMIVMVTAFAFETWYMIFGLSLLQDYFKKHFKGEFHVSQWGLVCPFVAYVVLGSFVYILFWQNAIMFWFLMLVVFFTTVLFLGLLRKNYSCARLKSTGLNCE